MDERPQLDLSDVELQRSARNLEENIGRVGQGYAEFALSVGLGAKIFPFEQIGNRSGAVFRRIDQLHLGAKEASNRCAQEWIMSATEDKGIDSVFDQRLQILPNDPVRDPTFEPAFFDQRIEQRTGERGNPHLRVERADCALISA